MRPLVFYHAQCRDGQASAWVARLAMPEAELVAVQYGGAPDLDLAEDREVYVIDFSWKRPAMIQLANSARHLTVLDHHKTAEAELAGLVDELGRGPDELWIEFDMTRSGAGIAWDHFFPGTPRPWIVNYVEDRDLWKWELHESREANAYIATLGYEPAVFDDVLSLPAAITMGAGALAAVRCYCAAACENAYELLISVPAQPEPLPHPHAMLRSYIVPSVTACQHSISEVLEHLMDIRPDAPFVVGWWRRKDGTYQYSLRSRGDFDVSEIAKVYGGGGHKNAAGFQSPGLFA